MHLRLADGIRGLFSNCQGKPILLNDMMAQLTDKTRGFFTSQKETHAMVVALSKILPTWLNLMTMPRGTYVKQLNPIENFKLRELIQAHFEKAKNPSV